LIPWASGDGVALSVKPVVGAVAEVMISLGISGPYEDVVDVVVIPAKAGISRSPCTWR
jgi:hypothetical protein